MTNSSDLKSYEKTFCRFGIVMAILLIIVMVLTCCIAFKKVIYFDKQYTNNKHCSYIKLNHNDVYTEVKNSDILE